MYHNILHLLAILLLLPALYAPGTAAAHPPAAESEDDQAVIEFPERITFSATLTSTAPIKRVELEYGTSEQACSDVIARAFPDAQIEGNQATATWTWEMLKSGAPPPGAQIWWRWRVIDENGAVIQTPQRTVTWLDDLHDWQTISDDMLNLHWYNGNEGFARDLLQAGTGALADLQELTGVVPEQPIDLYIYADTEDMRAAVLYEPGWTGGLAYSWFNIVIIGISPEYLDWGRKTVAHELTHVLIGNLTFNCASDMPTWLNEGLAVYGEGGPSSEEQRAFDTALEQNELLSIDSLSGGFSELADRANISYTQSYSLVRFLLDTYGREKLLALLMALRDGHTTEDALAELYGFDLYEFEDAWRASLGAPPQTNRPTPTPALTATPVPTVDPTAFLVFSAAAPPEAPPQAPERRPEPRFDPLPIVGIGVVLLFGIVLIVVALRQGRNPR